MIQTSAYIAPKAYADWQRWALPGVLTGIALTWWLSHRQQHAKRIASI